MMGDKYSASLVVTSVPLAQESKLWNCIQACNAPDLAKPAFAPAHLYQRSCTVATLGEELELDSVANHALKRKGSICRIWSEAHLALPMTDLINAMSRFDSCERGTADIDA